MNRIRWSRKAIKQAAALSAKDRKRIIMKISGLKTFPDCPNVRRLRKHQCEYWLRVGDCRVLFNFNRTLQVVSIERVQTRNERTYQY